LVRYRSSPSAMISSNGRHRSGCANASLARRSSSATCSGVRSASILWPSSARLSHSYFANSIRSFKGRPFACSNNSVALMKLS
jgi:hypothetical protein